MLLATWPVQCYAGNAARGMSLVALHNGGGTGIGKAIMVALAWYWTVANALMKSSISYRLGYNRRSRSS